MLNVFDILCWDTFLRDDIVVILATHSIYGLDFVLRSTLIDEK